MSEHMTNLELDTVLIDAVSAKRAVLFLGAGASIGATRPNGQKIPDAAKLADSCRSRPPKRDDVAHP